MSIQMGFRYCVRMKKTEVEDGRVQMMQSVKEKTIKREFEVKEEDVVNDDAFIGATYDLGGNGLKQKVLKGISDEEVYKLQFDRIDEAETFYNMLARVAGFSIRKDDLKRDKNGDIISRKWVCSREGQRATKFIENDKRQREPRSLTRVGCEAAFRVGLNRKDGKWIVKEFIGDHNHNLVDAINTQFLANLFWADSTTRMDYACFGDVLAFDTTYRTNAYKKPLVVLVGVNHHHQTVVFGCALLIDESVGTYEWVLETFLDAMMNKKPISVVTDGDKAMRKAIKKVLPDTCHRLCSWHLQRNAFTNVHIKDFSSRFARCMFMRGNEEEFEKVWHEMVANLGLNENRWVTEIYGKRKRWAEAYLRGNFFGGMRTTQRAILRIRQNEAKTEFESNNSSPFRCATSSPTLRRSSSSFIEAKNEIQNLTARMEELYNYNLKGKKIASDGATGTNQVRDPHIVKTKGIRQSGNECSKGKTMRSL
ncbi:hypothetical protein AAG906_010234 [Vitis piasezkii]